MKMNPNSIIENSTPLYLYKTKLDTVDEKFIKTLGKGLTGSQIDSNMLLLYGRGIDSVSFDGKSMILHRGVKDEVIELPDLDENSIEWSEDGFITVTNKETGDKIELGKPAEIFTDDTIGGKGTEDDPLSLNGAYVSGDLGVVDDMFITRQFEPEDSIEYIWKDVSSRNDSIKRGENRVVITRRVYPCEGTKEIAGKEYAILDDDTIRVLKNGEYITLYREKGGSTRYILEGAELIEVVNKINPADNVLFVEDGTSELSSRITIGKYNKEDGTPVLALYGKDGKEFSSIDVKEFVKDSFLKDVSLIYDRNDNDKAYLHFEFIVYNEDNVEGVSEVNVELTELLNSIKEEIKNPLDEKIKSLEGQIETLNETINKMQEAIRCLELGAIRNIETSDENQIKVEEIFRKEEDKTIKVIKIGFADDTYFIAGE